MLVYIFSFSGSNYKTDYTNLMVSLMNKNLPEVNQISDSDVAIESQDEISTPRKSRIVSRFLSPALKFWLKSQLEQVEQLKVLIEGGDRQILTGKIPQVSVAASNVVFRGLNLTEIDLSATGIKINIGQVIKGKPLKILESFPFFGKLKLLQSDFNASLQSPLLAQAIVEFLTPLLPSDFLEQLKQPINLYDQKAEIFPGRLHFYTNFLSTSDHKISLTLHTDLKLASSSELLLDNLEIQIVQKPSYDFSNKIKIDLGSDVELKELTLNPGQLSCQGRLTVNP
ncbi:DUF2993 domain-containing protein [Okeania sp. SIO2B3]|uniref:LmeA family phospholipid-binding protein n=1 Tax=Okeania sp. SIO2B3 TaxID=2607784 RepID=UPI0013C26260|nr:DUF2993 domain-containing protein [Okeania sp. SIO2B3]NET44256.1 DUF2993 domain-containing protein [Okeania sp. SIO2B3]